MTTNPVDTTQSPTPPTTPTIGPTVPPSPTFPAPVGTTARRLALAGAVLGLVSALGVIAGELTLGEDYVGSPLAVTAGWLGLGSACLLVLALTGLLAGPAARPARTRRLIWAMQLSATVLTAVTATIPLVVAGTHDRFPELVSAPPAAVPVSYIVSGALLGAASIALGLVLRRAGAIGTRVSTLAVVGSTVALVPFPARHFGVAFAVWLILRSLEGTRGIEDDDVRRASATA